MAGHRDPDTGEWIEDDPIYGTQVTSDPTLGDPSGPPPEPTDNGVGTGPVRPPDTAPPGVWWPHTNNPAYVPPPTTPPPVVDPRTNVPGGGGNGRFDYPAWTPPEEHWGTWTPPTFDVKPFEYADFVGPTSDTFQADPGYDFRAKQMDQAVKNAKSSQGLLSTGATLEELMARRGGLASQEFGNVHNRQFQDWNANRGKAFDTWNANYRNESDQYSRALTSYLTQEQGKEADWERSRTAYATNYGTATGNFGLNMGANNANFGNLLALYQIMMQNAPKYSATA